MLIPTGYSQLNIVLGGDGLPSGAQVTWGFKDETGDSPLVKATAIDAILAGCTNIFASTSDLFRVLSLMVKDGPNETGPSAEYATNITGTYSATESMPAVSYLIQKNTAMGGRQGRGRIYWPGCPLADVTETGSVDSNLVGDQNVGWTEFFTEMATAQMPLYLLRAESSPISTPQILTGVSCQTTVATQRRRQRR